MISTPPTRPLGASISAHRQAYEAVLGLIMSYRLKPYDLISEKGLAEALDMSRSPVREALAKLAGVGMVEIYAQRGTIVAPLRVGALERSQFLRESVEVGLLGRVIASPHRFELVEQLQGEISIQETLARIGDHQRFARSDELFHQYIATVAGFPGIWDDIATAKLHMNRFRALTPPDVESLSTIVEQHRAITQAILVADEIAAARAMQVHLRKIFPLIPELRRRFPDYFESKANEQSKRSSRPDLDKITEGMDPNSPYIS